MLTCAGTPEPVHSQFGQRLALVSAAVMDVKVVSVDCHGSEDDAE